MNKWSRVRIVGFTSWTIASMRGALCLFMPFSFLVCFFGLSVIVMLFVYFMRALLESVTYGKRQGERERRVRESEKERKKREREGEREWEGRAYLPILPQGLLIPRLLGNRRTPWCVQFSITIHAYRIKVNEQQHHAKAARKGYQKLD